MKTNAIPYLLLTKLKNNIKQLIKNPAKLIYAIVLIVFIGFSFFAKNQAENENTSYRNIKELTAGITALYIVIFTLISYNGFKNGASMFKMADVNLLFTSPIHPRKTLFYGLFQQMGTSLLLGFFIIFQFAWMNMVFGVTFGQLIFILLGYSLSVFAAQLTAMVIYSFTSYDEKRKKIAFTIYFGLIIVYVIGLLMYLLGDMNNIVVNLVNAGNSIYIRLMPAGGWIGGIVNGILQNNIQMILTGSLITVGYFVGMMFLLSTAKQDYYEDVLKASEDQQILSSAQKEGRTSEAFSKVKVGKTGLTKGDGASTFYYKHKLEDRRIKKFLLDPISIVFLFVIIIFSIFVRKFGIVYIFAYAAYMQLISVKMGRFSKELAKPYIYLVPESSFKKILYSIAEAFAGFLTEGVILFIALAFIMKLTPYDVVILIIARLSFSYLFLAANILIQRVFGTLSSRTLIYLFYIFAVLIMAAPGVILAAILSSSGLFLLTPNVIPFLIVTLCNIPITLLVIYLCRDVLKYAEMK